MAHYGPVSGSGVDPGSAGLKTVVGTGGTISRGYTGCGASDEGGEGPGVESRRGGGVKDRCRKLNKKGYCSG